MADSKITALTALTAADPANDMLPVVDVSDTSMAASGTTKRISINNILACSPSATLASATITGALTVDTTTLVVDPTNDRVGIGTATPAAKLIVRDGSNRNLLVSSDATQLGSAGIAIGSFTDNAAGYAPLSIIAGTSMAFGMNGTTAMTINSTGLGVGVTPYVSWPATSKALQLGASSSIEGRTNDGSRTSLYTNAVWNGTNLIYQNTAPASYYLQSSSVHSWYTAAYGTAGNAITFTQAMTLDASGNLLVGTTSAAGVRLDVQTTTGNCIGRVKSNAAASTASFIIDYVETLGCTYIKKATSDVWIYGVQNDTSATPAFKINTASNVGVQLVSGATAWTTLSDETVKDIIEPISNAVAKVGSLRSVIGKFKTDDASKRRSFLIAQDVQSVLPEAVDVIGENNELGLRYTEVIPLLVAAIKELTARVQTLEAK